MIKYMLFLIAFLSTAHAGLTPFGGSGAVDSVNTQSGIVVLDSDDISEGVTNLYHTTARAKAAAVADAINDSTTDVAPSQNAVFDALALKRDASSAVDLTSEVSGLLPVANQASQPVTRVIYVDKNRADSYTADGSITRPYKTILAANAGTTCNASSKCEFRLAPGAYSEDPSMKLKDWSYYISQSRDLVVVSHSDNSSILIDFTANNPHRMAIHNVTFSHGLVVDRTGDTTGGANVDLRGVHVGGVFTFDGRGSGVDYLSMKFCQVTGAATINSVSGIVDDNKFYSTMAMGTTNATQVDGYGYYTLVTFDNSYIAGNITATAAAAKPGAFQIFHTKGDGNWSFVGTAAIDLYTDVSGPYFGSTYTKTNVTTYRYGRLQNLLYVPAATNWAGTAPDNVHDALERMAALLKTLNGGVAIP